MDQIWMFLIFKFQLKPGHNNIIALSATKIDSSEDIRSIEPSRRNCLFPDENKNLTMHRHYTKTNCMLECSLKYAQSYLLDQKKIPQFCTPWFFPASDENLTICNPWEAIAIIDIMSNTVPESECEHCLPDCINVIYLSSLTTQVFRYF